MSNSKTTTLGAYATKLTKEWKIACGVPNSSMLFASIDAINYASKLRHDDGTVGWELRSSLRDTSKI
jgi:hypothetical protein